MKWEEFRLLSIREKINRRKKRCKAATQRDRFLRELEKRGQALPMDDVNFMITWDCWLLYTLANSPERVDFLVTQKVKVRGKSVRPAMVILNNSRANKIWRDIFFGFLNERSEFVPGIVSIMMMDAHDDPVEAYLINSDLSTYSLDEAVWKISQFHASISSETLRQRIHSWDK